MIVMRWLRVSVTFTEVCFPNITRKFTETLKTLAWDWIVSSVYTFKPCLYVPRKPFIAFSQSIVVEYRTPA